MPDFGYQHPSQMACPHCGRGLDGTVVANEAGIDDKDEKPTPGALGICAYCAGLQVYEEDADGNGSLRKPTPEEEAEAKENPVVARMQATLLDIKYRTNADGSGVDPAYDPDPDNIPDDKWLFKLGIVGAEDDDEIMTSRMKSRIPREALVDILRTLADKIEAGQS